MPKIGMEAKRRADVINAALTCISAYGIDGMTLDKVAEAAGCSKGVVAYYFKNKENLTMQALQAFMAYYGAKIQADIDPSLSAREMLDVTLFHMLPPERNDRERSIEVSPLQTVENMYIPYEDQARLFVQFFSKAVLDPGLGDIVSRSYATDLEGVARMFEYGRRSGQMEVDDPASAAYGLFALVVGLSYFRIANVPFGAGEDPRSVCEAYVDRFMKKGS